jgi:hypothetical protein
VSGLGELHLTMVFDDRGRQTGLRVERADDLISVAADMYRLALAGGMPFTWADPGRFAIETTTGLLRYVLTGERRECGALVARREHDLPAARAYLVGEHGPEIFVPRGEGA